MELAGVDEGVGDPKVQVCGVAVLEVEVVVKFETGVVEVVDVVQSAQAEEAGVVVAVVEEVQFVHKT